MDRIKAKLEDEIEVNSKDLKGKNIMKFSKAERKRLWKVYFCNKSYQVNIIKTV